MEETVYFLSMYLQPADLLYQNQKYFFIDHLTN